MTLLKCHKRTLNEHTNEINSMSIYIVSVKEINTFMLQVQAATGNVSTEVETALNATINVDEKTPAASKYMETLAFKNILL